MSATLLTGATGTLGQVLHPMLEDRGHVVRVLSRQERPAGEQRDQWRRGDLSSGLGLDAAVEGAEVIVHCASGRKDATETQRLVQSAAELGTAHLVYISIVGVDRVPMPYYRSKFGAEKVIEHSGLDYTILRATQFHDLVAMIFNAQRFSPVLFSPDIPLQPIAVDDVATALADLASAAPAGHVADLGGPEVTNTLDLARTFQDVKGSRKKIVPLRLPGKTLKAAASGALTAPDNPASGMTFREFMRG